MKRKITGLVLVLVMAVTIFGVAPVSVSAATINVPGDYATIQEAIDAASPGDTINVAAGTYYENITLKDGVEMLGAGAGVTIIDGGGSGSVVTAVGVGTGTKLDGVTITNGSADEGGGMYNYNSSLAVTNCTFSGNTADDGGGMFNYYSSPEVTNCIFSGNSAVIGGGIYNYATSPIVSRCVFSGNLASFGGGMSNTLSSPTVTNCTFSGNTADDDGGGVWNAASSPTVTNCIFSGNSAGSGGGIYNRDESFPIVTNCTFSGNSADNGGGIWNYASSPTVTNCILWDNGEEIYNVGTSTQVVTYCDVQGGYTGTGNINADPMFANPAAGDFHLQAGSPCIDVGDNSAPSIPSTDFEGDPRIMDGDGDLVAVVDMGVDEYCIAAIEVEIYSMKIKFDPTPNQDKIRIFEASFWLEEGASYDLDLDDVRVTIDGVVDIVIPAGSFERKPNKEKYVYRSAEGVEPVIVMKLDFETGEWFFKVLGIDASAVDNCDGVTVALAIGDMSGEDSLSMWIGSLEYPPGS